MTLSLRTKHHLAKTLVAIIAMLGLVLLAAGPVEAGTSSTLRDNACQGLRQLDATNSCGTGQRGFDSIVFAVINILSYIIGFIAVIMIIVAGLKYITSGGDSSKVSSAKTALVYAIVGLIIVALAQFLVRVVLNTAARTV